MAPSVVLTPAMQAPLQAAAPASGAHAAIDQLFATLGHALDTHTPGLALEEIGSVLSVATGVARVGGLPGIGYAETLVFAGGATGIALDLGEHEIGVVLLGDHAAVHAGTPVRRSGRVMDVRVGPDCLGRVIDPLGRALDGLGPLPDGPRWPIERPAPAIMDRAAVTVPLHTGLKVVDALVPIGRGQRELILGDRQTGKTSIAVDAILNQRGANVVCIYCAICQRASAVAKVVALLRTHAALDYTVVVVAEGSAAPGLAYVAPYAATSIGEAFMEAGRDVLIVYDDLTQHARSYRELSLLLQRPPGREAYPGDVFYLHSRLLERSTQLCAARGGGSMTALPIIETQAQDLSAYIPTNLISITDGQLSLSPTLFALGTMPAVDIGQSVSRVGGQAQLAALRGVAGDIKLAYAQFEELETFARFGARLDDATRASLAHGERIRACLKQAELAPLPVQAQVLVILALTSRLFDDIPLEHLPAAEQSVAQAALSLPQALQQAIAGAHALAEADRAALVALACAALAPLRLRLQAREADGAVAGA